MMNYCSLKQLWIGIILYFTTSTLFAQVNPYQRLSDPLAITYIDSLYPQKFSSGIAPRGFNVTDAGSGIITHIWVTFDARNPQFQDTVKIWIDDSLVLAESLETFFANNKGLMRAPLDTMMSGGLVFDVQMAYRKNFRINVYPEKEHCCLFWGIAWRPLPLEITPERFRADTFGLLAEQQKAAENLYHRKKPDYPAFKKVVIPKSFKIQASDTIEIAKIKGENVISRIQLKLDNYDQAVLDSLWMRIYWDKSPFVAVEVPVGDFFIAADSVRNVQSYYIHNSLDLGFISYFPMPFSVEGRIVLFHKGQKSLNIESQVEYYPEEIHREKHGYFFAQYNEIDKAKYKIYHQVAHAKGRGKYLGTIMNVRAKRIDYPIYLEGNSRIFIDSAKENYMEYPGTEDYFNGGWYFFDGPFALPFAGSPSLCRLMYRFHVLDALDFKKSLDVEWEHGVSNDTPAPYRTVGLFYKQWRRYWLSQDTITVGQTWAISGTGYKPNERIVAKLGSKELFSIKSDSEGSFKNSIMLQDISTGSYTLSVNDEEYEIPVEVISFPLLYVSKDSIPYALRYLDTVTVIGQGFSPQEIIELYIDSTYAGNTQVTATSSFKTYITIPKLDTGHYHVEARGQNSGSVISLNTFYNTRTLNYEFEDMAVQEVLKAFGEPTVGLGYWSYEKWSQQAGYSLIPDSGGIVSLNFYLPVEDTFKISAFLTMGSRYGNYDILLDGKFLKHFEGYLDLDFGHPVRSPEVELADRLYLSRGNHTVTFKNTGRHEKAFQFDLIADNLILKPITQYEKIEGNPSGSLISGVLFPNPLSRNLNQNITLVIPKTDCTATESCQYTISFFTILGELIFKTEASSSSGKIVFPVKNIPTGIYFCTFKNEQTGTTQTYSIIVTD